MMSHFDNVAREWDKNTTHIERSQAIAKALLEAVPLNKKMNALEYGAGTGLLSFLLHEHLSQITMMDSSGEMVNVMREKVAHAGLSALKPLAFDLEKDDYPGQKFDLVFNQMVMHHVNDVSAVLTKFYSLLNPGGYLAMADLYKEDGSFHGPEVKVHWGFEPADLAKELETIGFVNIAHKTCFVLTRENGRSYPIFLITAQKRM
ncbi:MAG TPA: class I SAM-dependent methyltransferase [Bacteroidales bacterium]|nr:class I SAM-dependent methyltransferase [Bacteroidales bacterium]